MEKKPALDVLGLSDAFVKTYPKDVVVSVADAVYRAIATNYHPDKNTGLTLPQGMSLADFSEARDAIREKYSECVDAVSKGSRATRERQELARLKARNASLQSLLRGQLESNDVLWRRYVAEKLGVVQSTVSLDADKIGYNTTNLNGVVFLVNVPGVDYFAEYACNEGFWFTRRMKRMQFGVSTPHPPLVDKHWITRNLQDQKKGFYYDSIDSTERLDNFCIVGSYVLSERTQFKEKLGGVPVAEVKTSAFAQELLGATRQGKVKVRGLDEAVFRVLSPHIAVGSTAVAAEIDADKNVRYMEIGGIINMRVFDHSQRG